MSGTVNRVLRPGSSDAQEAGCLCPVMDNARGRGYMGGAKDPATGKTVYVMTDECPLHGGLARKGEALL